MHNEQYLVSGATGFLGSCLVRQLVSQGKQVSVIVRDQMLNWRLSSIATKFQIFECDIQDTKLHEIVDSIKPDYIFHFASYGPLSSQNDASRMIDVNIKGTLNLINATKKNTYKLFINTGSSAEYGIKNHPMKETDILEPINDYGVAKAATTLLCQKEAMRNNLPIITFRLFTPYGYFEEQNRLIPWIVLHVLRNTSMALSSPDNVRDFIFVNDVVDAYLNATSITPKPGDIFNIGSGTQASVADIVRMVQDITKNTTQPLWGKAEGLNRQIEPRLWQADITKAKDILHWKPKNTLRSGLQKTIKWFSENLNLYNS